MTTSWTLPAGSTASPIPGLVFGMGRRNAEDHEGSHRTSLDADLRRALAAIARTPRLLVACDYDGTLAPIAADPLSVRPLPETMTALRSLAGLAETTAAVISGRALRELAAMSRLPTE